MQLQRSEHRVGKASLSSLLRLTSVTVFSTLAVATVLVVVVLGGVVESFTRTSDLQRVDEVAGQAAVSIGLLQGALNQASNVPVDLQAAVQRADREVRGFLANAAELEVPSVQNAVHGTLGAWQGAVAEIEAALRDGQPGPAVLHRLADATLGRMQGVLNPIWEATTAESGRRIDRAHAAELRLRVALATLLLGSLGVLAWFHGRVRRDVVVPLGALRQASDNIGRGGLEVTVPQTGTSELRDVIAAFNEMAGGLADRARLESELRHAQKLESVGQLAAGIAHEINTPIQFVGDNVRFLEDAFSDLTRVIDAYHQAGDSPQPEAALARARELAVEVDTAFLAAEVPQAVTQTLEGVDRVATIVRAMKAFGHPSGEHKASADLNEAVRNTLVVANNELKCVADVGVDLGDLPLVSCHLGDINQVLLNLVVNAAHAVADTGRQGTITVRTRHHGDEVVIKVADTGVGIPPEIAARVFEPFFTTKEVGAGTGQGLALAHSLVVDRHGGSITFDSEPGAGTTFTVRLPVAGGEHEELVA